MDDTNSLRDQLARAVAATEEARRRTEFSAAESRFAEIRRAEMMSRLSDYAGAAGRGAAVVVGGAALGAYSAAASAAPYMRLGATLAHGGGGARDFAATAFGMGGGPFADPTRMVGQFGQSFYSGRGFGGLLYEAGVGQALNAATMGLFFRDANRNVGLSPAMTQGLAQDELQARMRQFGQSFLFGLPVVGARMFGPGGATTVRAQRDIAQRLAGFSYEGGLPGGRGLSANDARLRAVTGGIGSALNQLNADMGYSLTGAQADDLASAATSSLSSSELDAVARSQDTSRLREAVNRMRSLVGGLRLQTDELVKLQQEYRDFGDEALSGAARSASRLTGSGTAGSYSGEALLRADLAARREARALGVSGFADQSAYGAAAVSRRLGLYHGFAGRRDAFQLFGENEETAAAAAAALTMRGGLGYAASAPGRTALFQSGAFAPLMAGGSYMDFVGAQSSAMLRDPFASTNFRFDARRQLDAQLYGTDVAYQESLAHAGLLRRAYGGMRGFDARKAAMAHFASTTGMSDADTMRMFEVNRLREDEMRRAAAAVGLEATPAQLLAFGRRAEAMDPSLQGDPRKLAELAKAIGVDATGYALRRGVAAAAEPAMRELAASSAFGPFSVDESYSTRSASGPERRYRVRSLVDTEDLQGAVAKLRRAGMTDEVIGAAISEALGPTQAHKVRVVGGEVQFSGDGSGAAASFARAAGRLYESSTPHDVLAKGVQRGLSRLVGMRGEDRLGLQAGYDALSALTGSAGLDLGRFASGTGGTPEARALRSMLTAGGQLNLSAVADNPEARRAAAEAVGVVDSTDFAETLRDMQSGSYSASASAYQRETAIETRLRDRNTATAVLAATARHLLPAVNKLEPRGNRNDPFYVVVQNAAAGAFVDPR